MKKKRFEKDFLIKGLQKYKVTKMIEYARGYARVA